MSKWVKYIGVPYITANCWRLTAIIQAEQFGINLPLFDDIDECNSRAVAKTIAEQSKIGRWHELKHPHHGSVVLLQRLNNPTHAGVFIEVDDLRGIIHTSQATGSVFQSLNEVKWSWNIGGYYAYVKGGVNAH